MGAKNYDTVAVVRNMQLHAKCETTPITVYKHICMKIDTLSSWNDFFKKYQSYLIASGNIWICEQYNI